MNILDRIFEAGIVGCGGAGFPTHVKLNTEVEYFIVNAAECEPLLRTQALQPLLIRHIGIDVPGSYQVQNQE